MSQRPAFICQVFHPLLKNYKNSMVLEWHLKRHSNRIEILKTTVILRRTLSNYYTFFYRSMCINENNDDNKKTKENIGTGKKKYSDLPNDTHVLQDTNDRIKDTAKITEKILRETATTIKSTKGGRRIPLDPSVSSLERNFVTPGRAMSDFLLKMEHLENIRATKRRSPYINQPPITVYWRKDVEAKALEVWGSKDNLLKEILRRQLERKYLEQSNVTLKRQLKTSRREILYEQDSLQQKGSSGLWGSSGRVVLSAVLINCSNFLVKLLAWICTGSHSMFAECIHSLADTMNQLILAFGIHKSVQKPNPDHPYGYTNMKYVSSLISGVGIFCVGTGLSVYHGIIGLLAPSVLESFYWAFLSLAGSLMSEGATCLVAIASIRKGAKDNEMSIKNYILTSQDPSVNVVLLEDCAALLSILVTASCIGLTVYFDNPIPDAIGSLLVGGILGAVASFIIYTNVTALVGRSIPQEFLDKINYELESDVMVRGIHDVKGIDMGNSLIRYKAELDFDGRELTRLYLDHQDLQNMFEEVKNIKTIDEFESFLLRHSENIIDTMGGEIDRIEVKLRKKFPQIRHCDLEIL
ncbi:hypothetical protein PGB90_002901 [Kerria lacca]